MSHTPARRIVVAVIAAAAALGGAAPAVADPEHPSGGHSGGHSAPAVVAKGLDNPRGLAFDSDGALYVAEAGRGGAGPCIPGPEGPEAPPVCLGYSGAVTQISHGTQKRVLTGLPSLAAQEVGTAGEQAIGPSDVSFRHERMFVTVGLGADPVVRKDLPEPAASTLGTLLRAKGSKGSWKVVADLADFEAAENPDGGLPDSNPNSVLALKGQQVVADAGGNSLVRVSGRKVSTVAVFPDRDVLAPPFLGLPSGATIPMQAVPTSVVKGPDGAYYVGELTGFPFEVGAARVWRIKRGHDPEVFATGFTNIIDLAFRGHQLYVLEIAHNGLLSGDPTGALIRVRPNGSHDIVLTEPLVTPGGLALRGGNAYISNCGTCPGTGEILRVPLHDGHDED